MKWFNNPKLFDNLDNNSAHELLRSLLQDYKNDNGEIDFKKFTDDSLLFNSEVRAQFDEEMKEVLNKADGKHYSLNTFPSMQQYQKYSMVNKEKILIQTSDEPRGDSEKTWVNLGFGSFLQRVNKLDKDGAVYTSFTEVVVNKLAKQVNLECADYDLSVDEDGRRGVISYNVLNKENLKNAAVYSLDQIFESMNFKKEEGQDGYYIEDALEALDGYCKKSNIDKGVRDQLIAGYLKNVVFDLAICQTDRHEQNTNFIYGVDKDGNKILKNSPLIDNELSLGAEKSVDYMKETVQLGEINPENYTGIDQDFVPKVSTKENVLSKKDLEGLKQLNDYMAGGGSIMDFFANRKKQKEENPYEEAEVYENNSINNILDFVDRYIDDPKNAAVKEMYNEWVAYDLPNIDIYAAIEEAEKEIGGNFKVDEVYKKYTTAVFDERFYNVIDPYIEKKTQEIEEIDDVGDIEDPASPGGDL